MTNGQVVALSDGSKAEVKPVRVNAWQTILVAVQAPALTPKPPTTH